MVAKDISLTRGGRIVISGSNLANIYLQDPVPVTNFTNITNHTKNNTTTSGNILFGTFPASGIDLYNRYLGAFANFNIATSGIEVYSSIFDIQYKRGDIPISGTKHVGRF